MRCPACGAELTGAGKFCEICGSPLSVQEATVTEPVLNNYQPDYQAQQAYQGQQGPQGQQSYFQGQQMGSQPGPYGVPPQGAAPVPPSYGQGPQKQPSNAPFVLSIIALVTAVLGIFPVSLVLAIIALVMNSGQKKRGEMSTKHTPTFVMSLIGLILSILMAIITVFIGSVIWVAAVSGEIDDIVNSTSSKSSVSANNSKSSTASAAKSSSASSEKSSSAASSASAKSSASSASPASPTNFSTTERPTLGDFQWFTADMIEGRLPAGSTQLTRADVQGGWKIYQFGSGMERFLNAGITSAEGKVNVTYDWDIVRDGSTGQNHEDNTPDSTFAGNMDGRILDATGSSGHLTITDFWQLDGHQYGVGSFVWPSGEVDNVLLVRP